MPSKSRKQAKLMAAAAHDPEFAAKVKVPLAVAKEFNKADKGTGILKKKGEKRKNSRDKGDKHGGKGKGKCKRGR